MLVGNLLFYDYKFRDTAIFVKLTRNPPAVPGNKKETKRKRLFLKSKSNHKEILG